MGISKVAVKNTGSMAGPTKRGLQTTKLDVELKTDDYTVVIADGGKTFLMATDAKTFTLPEIDEEMIGEEFTFVNTGADGNNLVDVAPNAVDAIHGTISNAAADSVSGGVVNKYIRNTKATSNKGDFIKIKALALTEWYIIDGVGIWASEA